MIKCKCKISICKYECIIIIKVSSIWMVYFLANRSASEGLLKAFLHACVDP